MSAAPINPSASSPASHPASTDLVLIGEPILLADRIEIFPQTPLPELNTPAGPAFAARLRGEARATLYAILCSENLPWRSDALTPLLGKNQTSLIRYRDSGMVDWPGGTVAGPLSARRFCLIHERPLGTRLGLAYDAGAPPQTPIEVEKLLTILLKPMTEMAAELSFMGLSHGNLHLNNLFISHGGMIQAGECVSCPPSFDTPPIFLTIERAQAHPAGRGAARIADDLYAIGVIGLIMQLGFNPAANLSPEDLMRLRLERGSFIAILGDHTLKGTATELFRSLLEDDPRRRWTLHDIETWLEGRRPTPKMVDGDVKPKRSLNVGDDQSHTRRGVAHLLAHNQLKGMALAENGDLQRWIERSIENEGLTKRTKQLFERAQGAGSKMPPAQLLAKAEILIDPNGPMRYKEMAVQPSGFGMLLATRMMAAGDIQPLVEILQAELPMFWSDSQPDHRADNIAMQQVLERAQIYIERKVIGYGVERALYELVPSQPCLSPMVRSHSPQTINQVLVALNKIADNAGTQLPMDRHLAAFFIARDRRIHEGLLGALSAPEGSIKRVIGTLSVLAEAQYRHGPEQLKGLAQWMGRLMEPATKRFFEKSMQEKARRELQDAAQKGDLIDMLNLLDSPDALDNDRAGFEDARMIWQQAEEDIIALQDDIDQKGEVERRVGQPLASALAVVLGIVAIGFVIAMALRGNYL